ncbi:GNAT family N-acetyltransferase [Enterococcus hailinensis]|uniref:GNAT family N-acetyltransferase n=1 Tax=Enterococcus hailinensis TaxID=3238988 RepID=UPI0038B41203
MSEIKKIDSTDLKQLQTISIRTFTDTFGKDNTEEDLNNYLESAYADQVLTDEINNSDSEFYFIYLDARVAGYLKLNVGSAQTETFAKNRLEIERIYIDPDFKRNGLGKKLYELAVKRAVEQSKDSIWLGVWEHNLAAMEFYKKMGFEKVGQHSFFMGEDEQIDFIMQKKI